MTLNLTKLESTHVKAASAEADFEQKNLQRLANHWALRSTEMSGRGWHRILIAAYKNDAADEKNSPKVDP